MHKSKGSNEPEDYLSWALKDNKTLRLHNYEEEKKIGTVVEMQQSKAHDIIIVDTGEKNVKIPYVDFFVERVDLSSNKMYVRQVEGLLHVED